MRFNSFSAYEVAKFRSAVLGQNKNNEKDAEGVARYALALKAQNRLEPSRRAWFADDELQTITRLYGQKRMEMTRETNWLWKTLHKASGDLYLAFRGSHKEAPSARNLLGLKGVLHLLAAVPDISSWHLLSLQELVNAAGGLRRGREQLLDDLRKLSAKVPPLPTTAVILIRSSAALLCVLQETVEDLEKRMTELTRENKAVQWLCAQRGIAVLTAAKIIAEIIDIRRFPTNNHLASYAGLARHERKTGRSGTEISTTLHNNRLKNAFFAAAKNTTLHNPYSHLAGYFRSLVKQGMPITEALKRVGRALVRRLYRELKALAQSSSHSGDSGDTTEGVMATGRSGPGGQKSHKQHDALHRPVYSAAHGIQ